nr:histone-lysine N-methyltransferase SETMAR-like [Columba livia]
MPIIIMTMELMLDKKQVQAIFLFEINMGHKAAETTHNNNTSGTGTAKEHTVLWWFKEFHKARESLEDEERSAQPLEVDDNQLRAIMEADPFRITREAAEELSVRHSMVVWYLKQIGKVEKLNKWVPHELTENKKKKLKKANSIFQRHLLLF